DDRDHQAAKDPGRGPAAREVALLANLAERDAGAIASVREEGLVAPTRAGFLGAVATAFVDGLAGACEQLITARRWLGCRLLLLLLRSLLRGSLLSLRILPVSVLRIRGRDRRMTGARGVRQGDRDTRRRRGDVLRVTTLNQSLAGLRRVGLTGLRRVGIVA